MDLAARSVEQLAIIPHPGTAPDSMVDGQGDSTAQDLYHRYGRPTRGHQADRKFEGNNPLVHSRWFNDINQGFPLSVDIEITFDKATTVFWTFKMQQFKGMYDITVFCI